MQKQVRQTVSQSYIIKEKIQSSFKIQVFFHIFLHSLFHNTVTICSHIYFLLLLSTVTFKECKQHTHKKTCSDNWNVSNHYNNSTGTIMKYISADQWKWWWTCLGLGRRRSPWRFHEWITQPKIQLNDVFTVGNTMHLSCIQNHILAQTDPC